MRAGIWARLSGILRGGDPSLVILSIVCLAGVLGSLALMPRTPWALAAVFGFLLAFAFLLYGWKTTLAARAQMEAPLTQIRVTSDTLSVVGPVPDQRTAVQNLLALLRAAIQSRQMPPPPRGQVQGNPADDNSLREYASVERDALYNRFLQEIPGHDRQVIEQIASAERALEATTEPAVPSQAAAPVRQPEKGPSTTQSRGESEDG